MSCFSSSSVEYKLPHAVAAALVANSAYFNNNLMTMLNLSFSKLTLDPKVFREHDYDLMRYFEWLDNRHKQTTRRPIYYFLERTMPLDVLVRTGLSNAFLVRLCDQVERLMRERAIELDACEFKFRHEETMRCLCERESQELIERLIPYFDVSTHDFDTFFGYVDTECRNWSSKEGVAIGLFKMFWSVMTTNVIGIAREFGYLEPSDDVTSVSREISQKNLARHLNRAHSYDLEAQSNKHELDEFAKTTSADLDDVSSWRRSACKLEQLQSVLIEYYTRHGDAFDPNPFLKKCNDAKRWRFFKEILDYIKPDYPTLRYTEFPLFDLLFEHPPVFNKR